MKSAEEWAIPYKGNEFYFGIEVVYGDLIQMVKEVQADALRSFAKQMRVDSERFQCACCIDIAEELEKKAVELES